MIINWSKIRRFFFPKKEKQNKEPEYKDGNSVVIYLTDHDNFPVVISFNDSGTMFVQYDPSGKSESELQEIKKEIAIIIAEAIEKFGK